MKRRNPAKVPPFKLDPNRIAYIKYQQYLLSMKRTIDSEVKRLQKSPTLSRSIRISAEANIAARQGFQDTRAPVIPYLPDEVNNQSLTLSQRMILDALLNSEGSEDNCGIGPSGFQPGNTCARGSSGTTKTEGVYKDSLGKHYFKGTLYRGGEIQKDSEGTFGVGYYFSSEKDVAEAYASQYGARTTSHQVRRVGPLFVASSYDDVVDPVRKHYGDLGSSSKELAKSITEYWSGKGYNGIAVSEHLISPTDTIVIFDKSHLK